MATAEHEAVFGLRLFEDFDRPGTQGYTMLVAALHTFGRNDPYLRACVDLIPTSGNYFVPPSRGQDQEFERTSRNALLRPQHGHEAGNLVERKRGMVSNLLYVCGRGQEMFEITAPASGIFAIAIATRPRPIQHVLDPAA
jgi:hypothetical protein